VREQAHRASVERDERLAGFVADVAKALADVAAVPRDELLERVAALLQCVVAASARGALGDDVVGADLGLQEQAPAGALVRKGSSVRVRWRALPVVLGKRGV
jgi:hypothetical protein